MHRHIKKNWLASLALPFALGLPQAQAYTHPCIPNTLEELDTIKANLNQEPWKQGYALLSGDGRSQLTYTMHGPHANVSRAGSYNQYLSAWRNDMVAVYNLARMWYFTGNEDYAQKGRDILIAWANTHTSFSGNESGLDLGDYAICYGGGASILRGTWPGWTAADTTAVKNYFTNVLWPASGAGGHVLGPANKGALYMQSAIAIAAFCDDTAKFDHVVNFFRTSAAAGLPNTLPTGEMGETGRDLGHGYFGLLGLTFVAEVAWKQGIDLYSELDNRLLACGEYYARNNLTTGTPFVPFGTTDYHYFAPSGDTGSGWTGNRTLLYLLQNAYKNRRGLPTPWIDRKLQQQPVDGGNFMFAKTADFITASPLSPATFPAVATITTGLTSLGINSPAPNGSLAYSGGTWSLSGGGAVVWTDGDDQFQFAYQPMSGDCAMVARVTSVTHPSSESAKAGIMIRDSLSPSSARRAWVAMTPQLSTFVHAFESYLRGYTQNWGGSWWAKRRQNVPPGLPYWLKIERRGNHLSTYASQDGTSWAVVNSGYFADLPSTLYIGLFACSVDNTNLTSATFTHVAVTGGNNANITTPSAPAELFASGSGKAITVRWLPSYGATAYDLLRSTTSGSGYTVIASNLTTAKTSYADTAVAAGTTYYYVVRAKNSAGTSGNSPQFGASLLPPMANLAFGGTATATIADNGGTEAPGKAFDRNPGSKWLGWEPTGSIQYDFGAGNAQVVKRYTVSSADVATRDPKSWNFRASQDGVSWTTLNSQSNQSFAVRMQMNTYNIGNTTAYRYYRLEITANNGDGAVTVAELGLWGDSGRTIPDGTYLMVSRKSNKVIGAGGTSNGSELDQWDYLGSNNQKWTFAHQSNGQYKITGVGSGRVMDVSGISTANGAKLHLWDWLNANNQKWTVLPIGEDRFKLTAVHSGKVADVSGGSTANGAKIHQWEHLGADNQEWLISGAP